MSGVPVVTQSSGSQARVAAAGFEALLFEAALKPLSKSLGFFGDIAAGAMARTIASHDDALTMRLEALFEAASR
jgi:hypothetical protein